MSYTENLSKIKEKLIVFKQEYSIILVIFRQKGKLMTSAQRILKLMKHFTLYKGEEIDSYDTQLQDDLDIGQRQLARELKIFQHEFSNNIVEIKKGKRVVYKLVRPIEILEEIYKHDVELDYLFYMLEDIDDKSEVLYRWNEISKKVNKPYLFFNTPYEDIKSLEKKQNFQIIKEAIGKSNVIDIYLNNGDSYKNTKPLKMLFSDGNWYIAYIHNDLLQYNRINFIKKVEKKSDKFYELEFDKYKNWFDSKFQNTFSRFEKSPKKAKLYATPTIARYFRLGTKKFFKSQQFIEETKEGGVIFSLEYTEIMEILPFIKKWLPNLLVIEPQELKEEFRKDIISALYALEDREG